MSLTALLVAAAAAAVPARPTPVPATTYGFTPESEVRYEVVHPLHRVVGKARRIEGTVGVVPGDVVVPFTLRVPLAAFDSGNANRDGNALVALGAAAQPEARLTITRLAYAWKTYKPGNVGGRLDFKATAHGELTLRGTTRPIAFPAEGWAMPADARVSARFPVSLAAFGIPAPALLFIPVADTVEVAIEAVARREGK